VSRIPLRLRLTVAFALAMALLLAVTGAFLYVRVRAALDEQIDASLEARSVDVASLVRSSDGRPGDLNSGEESFARIVRDGERTPLLAPDDLARARREPVFAEADAPPGVDGDRVRLYARPVDAPGGAVVVLTGATLEDRDEALAALRTQLLVGGPLALLLASVAGYALAAATLRPVLRWLKSGLERERRFVAEASHELRTPLASLKTELELALRRPRTGDELRAAVASAAEETDWLSLLADDLLVLARSDEAELGLGSEPVGVPELLETVARRFGARAAEAGRKLGVRAPRELVLTGDRLRLEQALGNLVDNALRYGAGDVQLAAGRTEGAVELSVADEGSGFPTEFLPRAFERFTRAEDARVRGAAGLGLALVEAIVRAHGGTAAAANRPGGGAVVTLVLPAG
jgi:two-component system, OmpR family, sensor kinase